MYNQLEGGGFLDRGRIGGGQNGRAARAEYETKYTAERNYDMLMNIYERVLHC
jgi:hypothetical protein